MQQPLTAERPQFVPDFNQTGPGTPAGRFMRRFWQPVGRSEELAAGKAKPIQIMSETFTLFRGASERSESRRCSARRRPSAEAVGDIDEAANLSTQRTAQGMRDAHVNATRMSRRHDHGRFGG